MARHLLYTSSMSTRPWRSAPFVMLVLACAPSRASATATVPPPSTVDATTVAATAAPPRLASTRNVGRPVPLQGEATIELGDDRSLQLRTDGTVLLGTTLLQKGNDYLRTLAYQAIVAADGIALARARSSDPQSLRTDLIDVIAIDPDTNAMRWHSVMSPHLEHGEATVQWRMLAAGNRLLMVEDHRVVAIDARTGRQLWMFWLYAPEFAKLHFSTIMADLRTLHVDDAVVHDRQLVLDVRLGDDEGPTTIELDVETGRRVYVESRRIAPVEVALSEFATPARLDPSPYYDDGPPTPPPVPLKLADHDGLAIGTTLLLWNTRTARGVIVNPTHDAIGEVLERARGLRIERAPGKSVPIEWAAVIDTGAIAESVARVHAKLPLVGKNGPALFDYGLVGLDDLEVVDAAGLAGALGVPAVTSHTARPKGIGLRLVRKPDAYTTIRVSWGPFQFDDINKPVTTGYVTPL